MNVIDSIIQNREQMLELVSKHGLTSLKLYGSVLARKETAESDIDFLAIFDASLPYDWKAIFNLQEALETYFGRRVGIVDSRRIPDVFRPSIDTEPVDIMELSSDWHYSIAPKASKLYYTMLDRMFREFDNDISGYSDTLYCFLAERLSWWFSRLLRLDDNDLKEYSCFDYVEVLYLCDKLSCIFMRDYTDEDVERFKEMLEKIKEYVQLRQLQLRESGLLSHGKGNPNTSKDDAERKLHQSFEKKIEDTHKLGLPVNSQGDLFLELMNGKKVTIWNSEWGGIKEVIK